MVRLYLRDGVLGLVLLLMLPYGGVTPAGVEILAVGAALLTLGMAISSLRDLEAPLGALRLALPLWLLAALAVAQLIPLPPWLRVALGGAPEVSLRVPLVHGWLPLTLNSGATAEALRMLVAVALIFVAALCSIERRSAAAVATLLLAGAAVIAAGSIWNVLAPGSVFPLLPGIADDRARGPLVNPNHFADWLAALLPLGVAGALSVRRRGSWLALVSVAALPFLAAALGLTFSRGGLMAGLAGLGYFTARAAGGRRRRLWSASCAAALALVAALLWAGGSGLAARLSAVWIDPLGDMRLAFWRSAARAAMQVPLFGSGLGTFLEGTRRFVGDAVPTGVLVDYAHSEPLQLAVEMGAAGVLLVAWMLGRWWRAVVSSRAAQAGEPVQLGTAAEAGVVALLVGSLLDFGVRIPAVGALGALLAALAIAARRPRATRRPASPLQASLLVGGAVAIGVVLIVDSTAALQASRLASRTRPVSAALLDWSPAAEGLEAASALEPAVAEYQARLGQLLGEAGRRAWAPGIDLSGQALDSAERRARVAQALYVRATAVTLEALAEDRSSADDRRQLASLFAGLSGIEDVFGATPFQPAALLRFPVADDPQALTLLLYRDAADLEPRNAELHFALGDWALRQMQGAGGVRLQGENLAPLEEVARQALRRAVALEPERLSAAVVSLVAAGASYGDVRALGGSDDAGLWRMALAMEQAGRRAWSARLAAELTADSGGDRWAPAADDFATALLRRRNSAAADSTPAPAGDSSRSAAILRQMATAMPRSGTIRRALGTEEWRLRQFDEAEGDLLASLPLLSPGPLRERTERDAGFVLIDAGDFEAARAHFERLRRSGSGDAWLVFGEGMALDRMGRWLDATAAYQQARALGRGDDDLCYQLGHQYFRRGLYEEAAAVWEDGVRAAPDSVEMHLWLARSYERSGRHRSATRQYRQVLRLRPQDAEARHELAEVLARSAG